MAYLLNKDVFLQAQNMHYKMSFCPAFWRWLVETNKKQLLFTIDKVINGIEEDEEQQEFNSWILKHKKALCKNSASLSHEYYLINEKFRSGHFVDEAVYNFVSSYEYHLIAVAIANKYVIVTHEVKNAEIKYKVNLPYFCELIGIKCITPFEMLKLENPKFILKEE